MDIQTDSDESLAKAALKNEAAFGTLIDRYDAKLRRYVRRLGVHRPEDQDDVLQEVFIKVYRNLNGFDETLSFSSWIYRITHNESISWYRKENVRPEGHLVSAGDDIVGLLQSDSDSAESVLSRKFDTAALESALLGLDDKYREVLILRFFEYKEYDEISDILKIPIGSVGTLIHRAKKKLHSTLESTYEV